MRVALATAHFMKVRGLTVSELAHQADVDKRDLRRLLSEQSCGPNLEDALEAFFGWDFTEMVAHAVHGADPLTSREEELERHLAQAAALSERLARERAARDGTAAAVGAPPLADVVQLARAPAAPGARARREHRAFAPPTPSPA